MIVFPSENLSALDWTSDQWPVQYVRGRDVILFLYSTETIETVLWLHHQRLPVNNKLVSLGATLVALHSTLVSESLLGRVPD